MMDLILFFQFDGVPLEIDKIFRVFSRWWTTVILINHCNLTTLPNHPTHALLDLLPENIFVHPMDWQFEHQFQRFEGIPPVGFLLLLRVLVCFDCVELQCQTFFFFGGARQPFVVSLDLGPRPVVTLY